WPEPVSTKEALDAIAGLIGRKIIIGNSQRDACALYLLLTWVADRAPIAPLLYVKSGTRRCGKTQLLRLLGRIVCRPKLVVNISPAVFFRLIETARPTLVWDEIDAVFSAKAEGREEMRGMLNAGIERELAIVQRCAKDEEGQHRIEEFNVFGPKIIAG